MLLPLPHRDLPNPVALTKHDMARQCPVKTGGKVAALDLAAGGLIEVGGGDWVRPDDGSRIAS
jgi:hypothetical protein